MLDGIIQAFVMFVSLVGSLFFPFPFSKDQFRSKRKQIFTFVLISFALAIGIGGLTYYSVQKKEEDYQIKSIQLDLLYGQKIEFPNKVEDWDDEFYVPFRLQFVADVEVVKIARMNEKGKWEDLNKKIYDKTKEGQKGKINFAEDSNELILKGGSIDLIIPITANHVLGGLFKLQIEKTALDKSILFIDRDFEVLVPIEGISEAWGHTAQINYSAVPLEKAAIVEVNIDNFGMESDFNCVLDILDVQADKKVDEKYYDLEPQRNVQIINKVDKQRFSRWSIRFKKKGRYILDTSVKKQVPYFDIAYNSAWKNNFKHQRLIIDVLDLFEIPESTETLTDAQIDSSQLELSFEKLDQALYKLQKGGAILYSKPSIYSKKVVDRTLYRNTRVLVFGKGKNAREIIRSSRDFVKVEVVALEKKGYLLKDFF